MLGTYFLKEPVPRLFVALHFRIAWTKRMTLGEDEGSWGLGERAVLDAAHESARTHCSCTSSPKEGWVQIVLFLGHYEGYFWRQDPKRAPGDYEGYGFLGNSTEFR